MYWKDFNFFSSVLIFFYSMQIKTLLLLWLFRKCFFSFPQILIFYTNFIDFIDFQFIPKTVLIILITSVPIHTDWYGFAMVFFFPGKFLRAFIKFGSWCFVRFNSQNHHPFKAEISPKMMQYLYFWLSDLFLIFVCV